MVLIYEIIQIKWIIKVQNLEYRRLEVSLFLHKDVDTIVLFSENYR